MQTISSATTPPSPNEPDLPIIGPPVIADAANMWRLARETLDLNSAYSYLMLAEHFADTCAVARAGDDGPLLGFVTGFRLPADPATLFIWQIAVSSTFRGRNLASELLQEVAERPLAPRLRYLEATVTTSNEASARTFRRFARRQDTNCTQDLLFEADHFAEPGHEAEIRFRIGPF